MFVFPYDWLLANYSASVLRKLLLVGDSISGRELKRRDFAACRRSGLVPFLLLWLIYTANLLV